jgi:lipopolysaccharide/colanic/teichoic acid biosynthesis glycosyltransferase
MILLYGCAKRWLLCLHPLSLPFLLMHIFRLAGAGIFEKSRFSNGGRLIPLFPFSSFSREIASYLYVYGE